MSGTVKRFSNGIGERYQFCPRVHRYVVLVLILICCATRVAFGQAQPAEREPCRGGVGWGCPGSSSGTPTSGPTQMPATGPSANSCDGLAKTWNDYLERARVDHEKCLKANNGSVTPGPNGDVERCSVPQCQSLHDITYGDSPMKQRARSEVAQCRAQAAAQVRYEQALAAAKKQEQNLVEAEKAKLAQTLSDAQTLSSRWRPDTTAERAQGVAATQELVDHVASRPPPRASYAPPSSAVTSPIGDDLPGFEETRTFEVWPALEDLFDIAEPALPETLDWADYLDRRFRGHTTFSEDATRTRDAIFEITKSRLSEPAREALEAVHRSNDQLAEYMNGFDHVLDWETDRFRQATDARTWVDALSPYQPLRRIQEINLLAEKVRSLIRAVERDADWLYWQLRGGRNR